MSTTVRKPQKIAIGSDMSTHLTQVVVKSLKQQGYDTQIFGSLVSQQTEPWPKVAAEVAEQVGDGTFDQAILFCWTGTGISMAANKVRGVRAALCNDTETARGARLWNNANVLAMSLRLVSESIAKEILQAWFETGPSEEEDDQACLTYMDEVDQQYTRERI